MKYEKCIIVLLVTMLAAGMAFAGLTGDASVQFTFNLDEGKGYGFGASNSQSMKYSFDFTIDILGPKSCFQYSGSLTTDDDGNPNFAYACGTEDTAVNDGGVNVLYDSTTRLQPRLQAKSMSFSST